MIILPPEHVFGQQLLWDGEIPRRPPVTCHSAVMDVGAGPFPDVADARRVLYPTALTIERVLVVARWLTLLWMIGIVVVSASDEALDEPVAAGIAVVAVLGVAACTTWAVRERPAALLSSSFLVGEAALAIGLSVLDGWVFEPGHVFAVSQSLATHYPLIAVASIGLARGPLLAAALGATIGPAEWLGAQLNDFDDWSQRHVVSLIGTSLYFAAAGLIVGWLARLLRSAEAEIADRRARDEVARVLHDTVLQTLALVERRTRASDPDLARTAAGADRALRSFLFGRRENTGGLERQVRDAVDHAVRHHGATCPVTVNVVDIGVSAALIVQQTVAAAVGEAVANALEHADATHVVVFLETDDDGGIFASVHDDGTGFDPSTEPAGVGIEQSMTARLNDIGGRVEIVTAIGSGTEVRLWST